MIKAAGFSPGVVLTAACLVVGWAGPAGALPVQGQVVHGSTGLPVPGLEVRVLGMEAGQPPVEGLSRTGPDGRFHVDLQPPRRTYVVQATYRGVTYTSGPHRAKGGPLRVTLRVFETTRRPPPLSVARRSLLLALEAPWFVVRELVVVHNPVPQTYVGQAPGSGTWRVPLLRGAEGVRVVRGMLPAGVDPDGALVDTLPVLPGERAAVLAYRVRARGPSLLELPMGLPTATLDVFLTEPLRARSEALRVRQTRSVEGQAVTWMQATGLAAEAVVPMEVEGVPQPSRAPGLFLAALLALGCGVWVAWPWARG